MAKSCHDLPEGPRLNLGCGPVQPAGWVNIDGSLRAFLASRLGGLDNLLVASGILSGTEFNKKTRYHNLGKGLPFPDDSVACIYAGELWEHFDYPDAFRLTKTCYRVLEPKGVLRVCVPDGPRFLGKYLRIYQEEMAKPRPDRDARRPREHIQLLFQEICTRRAQVLSMGHTHKWIYDEIQLIDMFEANGFAHVDRMCFHDSRIPGIEDVERSDYLIVEGVKPS